MKTVNYPGKLCIERCGIPQICTKHNVLIRFIIPVRTLRFGHVLGKSRMFLFIAHSSVTQKQMTREWVTKTNCLCDTTADFNSSSSSSTGIFSIKFTREGGRIGSMDHVGSSRPSCGFSAILSFRDTALSTRVLHLSLVWMPLLSSFKTFKEWF